MTDEDVEWYDKPGKSHFYKVYKKDGEWYYRAVNPIVGGGYRIHRERKIISVMVSLFKEDHPKRERPEDWDDAYKEYKSR